MLERYADESPEVVEIEDEEFAAVPYFATEPVSALSTLPRVSILPPDHAAVQLVSSRKIPEERWRELRATDDWPAWVNTVLPGKYPDGRWPDPRLVIPFVSRDGVLVGLQGRTYPGSSSPKYMTVSLDKTRPFFYGADRIDVSSDVIIVEGPIDSMFLTNSVASAGGVIYREVKKTGLDESRFIVAYDNEPRSTTTVGKMEKAIELGFRVFVWPESVRCKDFNDWFLSGATTDEMMRAINDNSPSGLEASLAVAGWRKV